MRSGASVSFNLGGMRALAARRGGFAVNVPCGHALGGASCARAAGAAAWAGAGMTDEDGQDQRRLERLARLWRDRGRGLITVMDLRIERVSPAGVRVRMPFNPDFCLDADRTLLHGGVLTALLDSVFGLSNFVAIEGVASMATLDLRVDYLRPARSRADVVVEASCYRQTRHIAFNTGSVRFDDDEGAEVARGAASFALTRGEVNLLEAAAIAEGRA